MSSVGAFEAGATLAVAGVVAGCASNVMNNDSSSDGGGSSGDEAKKAADKAAQLKKEWKDPNGTNDWDAGTVTVVRVFDRVTGEYQEIVTVENEKPPPSRMGKPANDPDGLFDLELPGGEKYARGANPAHHAEQNAIDTVKQMNKNNAARGGSANRYQITEGGTSRNICDWNCAPYLEENGFEIGPPGIKGGTGNTTTSRQFLGGRGNSHGAAL